MEGQWTWELLLLTCYEEGSKVVWVTLPKTSLFLVTDTVFRNAKALEMPVLTKFNGNLTFHVSCCVLPIHASYLTSCNTFQ